MTESARDVERWPVLPGRLTHVTIYGCDVPVWSANTTIGISSGVQFVASMAAIILWTPAPTAIGLYVVAALWASHWYARVEWKMQHKQELRDNNAPNWRNIWQNGRVVRAGKAAPGVAVSMELLGSTMVGEAVLAMTSAAVPASASDLGAGSCRRSQRNHNHPGAAFRPVLGLCALWLVGLVGPTRCDHTVGPSPGSWSTGRVKLLPPPVDGVPEPRTADALRILGWSLRGFHYGARHGKPASRAYCALLAILGWVVLPVFVVAQVYLLNRRAARYYLSRTRDAVLAIVATAEGWQITDHMAARPGTGRGRILRALVLPELCAAADAAGITLHTTAVNERLAAEYAADLPGLVDIGRASWRGRAMQRLPRDRQGVTPPPV